MKTITIKGTEYELQPFTAGQLRHEASAKLAAIEAVSQKLTTGEATPGTAMPDLVGNCCDLVFMSIRNGSPNITMEDVETLSFPNLQLAVTGACEVSGLSGETRPQPTQSL